jgi:tetratricopeptide (TPR) repeat protein
MAGRDGRGDAVVSNNLSGSAYNAVQANNIGTLNIGGALPPAAIPRQAPPPPHGFVDRVVPLGRLVDLAEREGDGRPVVVALHGTPGVGKTALLRTAVARIGGLFPDGVLHADFGPLRHRGAAAVSDVAASMLRALGMADQWIPVEFAGRIDLLRSMTAESRLLVVLDDVAQDAQVTALLPNSPRSMVLVAGNRTLEGLLLDGAVDIEVRSLAPEDCVELLVAMCPDGRITADPARARALAELCDRLPLALRVVGARLASHPNWPVTRLLDELSDASGALDDLVTGGTQVVRAVFDLAYDDMPPATARVYRMVGLLVGSHFGIEVVAAMSEQPVRTARRVLDELGRLNMLDERADGGFQLHRLVRLHALGRSEDEDTPEQRVSALRRALRWWLTRAVAADVAVTGWERLRTVDPGELLADVDVDQTPAEALDWLELEHANLFGLLRAGLEHGWYQDVSQLFEALYAYYDNRQPLAAWTEAGELAVASARRSGNGAAEARARCQLAKALQKQDRFADAHAQLTIARTLAEALDERLFASTLDFAGNVHLNEGEFQTALDYFQRALAINERLHRKRGTALMYWLSGRALDKLGRIDEALDALAKARTAMESADAVSMVPRVVLTTGEVLLAAGRIEQAAAAADTALELANASGLHAAAADALVVRARVAGRGGDVAAERDYLSQAESTYARMESPRAARIHARLAVS